MQFFSSQSFNRKIIIAFYADDISVSRWAKWHDPKIPHRFRDLHFAWDEHESLHNPPSKYLCRCKGVMDKDTGDKTIKCIPSGVVYCTVYMDEGVSVCVCGCVCMQACVWVCTVKSKQVREATQVSYLSQQRSGDLRFSLLPLSFSLSLQYIHTQHHNSRTWDVTWY